MSLFPAKPLLPFLLQILDLLSFPGFRDVFKNIDIFRKLRSLKKQMLSAFVTVNPYKAFTIFTHHWYKFEFFFTTGRTVESYIFIWRGNILEHRHLEGISWKIFSFLLNCLRGNDQFLVLRGTFVLHRARILRKSYLIANAETRP